MSTCSLESLESLTRVGQHRIVTTAVAHAEGAVFLIPRSSRRSRARGSIATIDPGGTW